MDWNHLEYINKNAMDAATDLAVIRHTLMEGEQIRRVNHALCCLEEIIVCLRPKAPVTVVRPAPESVVECGGR